MAGAGRGSARPFAHGARDALALPAWIIGLSMAGIGPLAREVGYPLGAAVLSTALVWAGPAQVVFFSMMGVGASLGATAFAVTLTAIRLLPMTASLMPALRAGGARRATLLAASQFIAVTVWAEMTRRLPGVPTDERRSYFFGFATACMGLSMAFTTGGYLLAGQAPASIGAALLFMPPAFFLLSLMANARIRADWFAIGAGLVLTPLLGAWLGPGAALFVAGLVGGTAAFLWQRLSSGSGRAST